jgi:RNA polymerase sigma-70 factor, ECF subfamily
MPLRLTWLRRGKAPVGTAALGDDTATAAAEKLVTQAAAEEANLVERLRAGDEAAFVTLVDRYHSAMLRVALLYVSDPAADEEVVQETWLAVVRGVERFEGRSSLKTWLFRILTNCAKTRGQRERRTVPFSSVWSDSDQQLEPVVDPARFDPNGRWLAPPQSWEGQPEQQLLAAETRRILQETIASLPSGQQQVLVLRDIEGWTAAEVCNALAISDTNQRVLLHRGRSVVRRSLERYLAT